MSSTRALLLAGASLLLAGAPSAARDPVRYVAFAWVRGDGADRCPSQPEMTAAVRARLGRDPFSAGAPVSAEVSVERAADRWRARLIFRDAGGAVLLRRDLDDGSPDCATIASAVALSVSLALVPTAEPTPVPQRFEAPEPPPRPPPPPPPPPRERARTTLGAEVVLRGLLQRGTPGVVWRLDVPLGRRWALWGAVAFDPERRTDPDPSWALGMTRATLGACWRPLSWWRFEFDACLGASVGLVHAVTVGLAPIEPGNYPWLAAVGELHLVARPRSPLVLDLGASAALAFVRNDFVTRSMGREASVFAQDSPALTLSLAGGVEF